MQLSFPPRDKCPCCYGGGHFNVEMPDHDGQWKLVKTTCYYCDGAGYDPFYSYNKEELNVELLQAVAA